MFIKNLYKRLLTNILLRLILLRRALHIADQLADPPLLRTGQVTPQRLAPLSLHAQLHMVLRHFGLGLNRGARWLPPVEFCFYYFYAIGFLG